MSEFNYPIQIDDSTYIKTIGDYDYNRIFDYLVNNTDWDATLKKIINYSKVGIEDSNIERKAYDYSLLLRYFNNLSNYCRKATTTERNNMYCTFISCLESSFVCRNNPKIIRDLADLLCLPHTATNTSCCSDYTYDIFTYDILSYTSSCGDFDNTINTSVSPIVQSTPSYVDIIVDDFSLCKLTQYRLSALGIDSSGAITMYKLFPPLTPINNVTQFVLNTNSVEGFGKSFTYHGALLDSSWSFNISHKKQYLAYDRSYLFRYLNNEWHIDDVNTNKYEDVVIDTVLFNNDIIQYFILKGGNSYSLRINDISSYGIYLDNAVYNKGLYIKVTMTGVYSSPTLTFKYGTDSWTISSGETLEWYSDGTTWILQ